MRLGILGGTFNPPHVGHLVCAQEAHAQLGLDRVLLMPANIPPHKEIAGDPGATRRLELCELAIEGDERFAVSDLELRRPGPSYTVATLRELHDQAPQDELTFIVGGDMAKSLPSWREPDAILELARIAIAERTGAERDQIREALAALPAATDDRIIFFDMPRIDISSSTIRERVAAGRPIRHLVPDAVAERLAADGLYTEQART